MLESRISGSTLMVQVQSNGKPVPNVAVSVKTSAETMKIFTDNTGMAKLDISGLNVTGSMILTVDDQNYEKKTIVQRAEKSGGIDFPAVIGIIVVVVLLIVALLSIGKRGGKEKSTFREVGKTSLNKV